MKSFFQKDSERGIIILIKSEIRHKWDSLMVLTLKNVLQSYDRYFDRRLIDFAFIFRFSGFTMLLFSVLCMIASQLWPKILTMLE